MPQPPKKAEAAFRHWISFVSGEAPFAMVLPDRKLYDAFAAWLHGQGSPGYSFRNAGQEMSINFAHVQRMEVEPVAEPRGAGGDLGNPVPLTTPPTRE